MSLQVMSKYMPISQDDGPVPPSYRPTHCKHLVRIKRQSTGGFLSEAAANWLTRYLGEWEYSGDLYLKGICYGQPGRNWTLARFARDSVVMMFECKKDAEVFEYRFGRQRNHNFSFVKN